LPQKSTKTGLLLGSGLSGEKRPRCCIAAWSCHALRQLVVGGGHSEQGHHVHVRDAVVVGGAAALLVVEHRSPSVALARGDDFGFALVLGRPFPEVA
jgi:hypothetical protein